MLVAASPGNYDEAVPLVTEGLVTFAQLDARDEIVSALEELSDTANDQGKLEEAALLAGTRTLCAKSLSFRVHPNRQIPRTASQASPS